MRAEGLGPHGWGNGPGDTYGWHERGYEKVLYCVRGQIVFRTAGGDIELGPGGKLVLPPHTAHGKRSARTACAASKRPARETRAPVNGIRQRGGTSPMTYRGPGIPHRRIARRFVWFALRDRGRVLAPEEKGGAPAKSPLAAGVPVR